ncbi:CoxG family protein [Neobacillus vireti]|uniref:Carbon monoxide dehydrogenase subunit G n=1 Tax=Neobacillus vireti LMG 21834 TaxID=1131730 RepID=A0AB94IU04_9BACI|nr:SRPBCC domain-containing protein [Neobacillus vireti]ETI70467.1 carbon monoxide dehydrogenase subunit G [Neobacillus vireti LMG 21834]KLT19884.1 carbon monoxide dehydrogenase [Neobacillus vireti]
MKIEYGCTLGLPRGIVWRDLKDGNILRNSLPGCKSFVEQANGIYQAELEINIGPIDDVFIFEIWREKEKSPSYYRLLVKGKGNLGEIDTTVDILMEESQGATKLTFCADAQVTGVLSLAGERILAAGAKKSLESFFQKMEKEMKRRLYQLKRGSR